MKKLIIALAFGCGLGGYAQNNTSEPHRNNMEKLTPEQRQQKHLEKLTKELNLSATQQEQVKQVLAEKSAKMHEMKDKKASEKESPTKMTKEEKAALKTQMQAEKNDMDLKMKNILSADQYQKWNTLKEEHKKSFKKKHIK